MLFHPLLLGHDLAPFRAGAAGLRAALKPRVALEGVAAIGALGADLGADFTDEGYKSDRRSMKLALVWQISAQSNNKRR